MNKNITIAISVAIVLLLGIIVAKIKIFTSVDYPNEGQETLMPSPVYSVSSSPSISEIPSVLPQVTATPAPPTKPAVYQGRPPEELRPVVDEVKLFSETQKQEIYRSLQNFGKSVKENPDFFDGWIQLGLLKKTIGDFVGAQDAWEYASIIRPQNSLSFANLGELYWRYLHLYPQAEINFKASIKNNPSDPGTYVSLSELYFYSLKDKADFADDILLQGIAANPESVDIPRALAHLYGKSGQYAKAIEWWQKVLESDPKNAEIIATIDALKKKLSGQ